MPPLKRLFGTVVLVVFVMVYAFVAAVIGDMTMQNASELVRVTYYLIAGLLWTIPAGALIWWMYRR